MKKFLAFLLASALLFAGCAKPHITAIPTFVPPSSSQVIQTAGESVSRFSIQIQKDREIGSCTVFAIAPRKFMTAAHCIADNVQDMWGNNFQTHFTVDGLTATVIKVDHERDLAVVLVDEVKPSLEFRDEPLALYEDVNGIGFGYGLNDYLVTPNKAEILNYRISIEGKKSWPGTVFMGPFIGGMSGGPIIDKNGKVVGVVQAADSITAYGVNVATIQEFLAAK